MNIKAKLQEIKKKVSNPKASLSEIEKLFVEFNEITFLIIQDKEKKEEKKLSLEVSEMLINSLLNSIDRWEKGEIDPSEAEVSFLYTQFLAHLKLEANWADFEKNVSETKHLDENEKQESIKVVKKNIEKFKKRQPDLAKLLKKWEEKHRKENSNSEGSDELSSEEKNNNEESSHSTSSDASSSSKTNKKDRGFPVWGIILIIFGVLAIAGIIGYFVLERKEKSNRKA